ncbi:lytic transglycosylase domain-containing protein [Plastoroseomonas hellenica]|uniref:lytic transglycosylase domain-containing protein n=1 Tax=Plastoroseomonas hellenica TaxID=2687306 RepID=UPI001BAC00D1|nr:lytic transglycosylase domain-containing protein [Plastoroseomonas hellenica]MBR0642106.1 lytic transglycosylase domain-containing protein [Plastoroseomonas hellenica]
MAVFAALLVASLAALLAAPGAALAQEDPWGLCRPAIERASAEAGIPAGLMMAIARVESGRREPLSGRIEPWPYAINAGGEGRYAGSQAEAVALVQGYLISGQRSIDVGCMQVNLAHHATAFGSLTEAFDPLTNARYAASFLRRLEQQGGWDAAVARYHSATPERGEPYRARVMAAMAGLPMPGGVAAPPARAPDPHVIVLSPAASQVRVEVLGRRRSEAPTPAQPPLMRGRVILIVRPR